VTVDDTDNLFENNLFSNHFLKERINELDEWQEANLENRYMALVKLYKDNQRLLSNDPVEPRTWSNFTSKVFKKILGHYSPQDEPSKFVSGTEYNPDYTLFKDKEQFLDAQEEDNEFETCYAIVENKRWDRTLDKSTQDHRNPAFQTYNYVDRLRVNWGILTNGKKWRLYSYKDCEADTFYQIDVVEQIIKEDDREKALRNFKYFYLFFSKEAFTPKENGFADKVLKGSFNYAQSLEEDLEKRIYDALEETSRGFFEFNDLEKTEENVELVHRSSLILLYRLLFVLNAESRELLPVNEKLYRNKLSVAHFRESLKDEEDGGVFGEHDWAWDRLTRLFKAIDSGKQYGDYKITAYNGGLFRYPENADEDEEVDEENVFLANHKLSGQKFKEILKLLALSENEEEEEVLVDYKDLNIRHLGSVYEGLLEHELQVAEEDLVLEDGEWTSAEDSSTDFIDAEDKVEEGKVYLTNESGERKATGSYYTPEYIVEYIVENTVKPKVEQKIQEADDDEEILEKVKELNICDPAMGSGHFLTEATSFIAHKIAEEAQLKGKVDEENEIVWLKRQVVQNSIYGVDINPLAVELGKLSLWIETMAEGKPLSFLDHHLKVGNSLVGTSIEELEHHPEIGERPEADFEEIFGVQNARDALHLEYKKIEDMEEETKEDVHEKEQAYREFREENFYYKFLKKLSNVHTYLSFENKLSPKEYNQIRNEVMDIDEHEGEEWYNSAQNDAEARNYFHWELEFPKVFFSTDSGFDAVIGNPPYARIQSLKEHFPEAAEYYEKKYDSSTQNFDIYANFTEKGYNLLGENGLLGYIEPHKFFQARFGEGLRKFISERKAIYEITSFEHHQVFEEASVYTCVLVLSKKQQENFRYAETSPEKIKNGESIKYHELEATYDEEKWSFYDPLTGSILEKIDGSGNTLNDLTRKIFVGIQTSADKIYLLEKVSEPSEGEVTVKSQADGEEWNLETEYLKPLLKGDDVHRYQPLSPRYYTIFPYNLTGDSAELASKEEIKEKAPETWKYLKKFEEELRGREGGSKDHEDWYEFGRTNNLSEFEAEKIMTPEISHGNNFTYDSGGLYHNTKVYSIALKEETEISEKFLLSVLNNPLLWFFLSNTGYTLRGGYFTFKTDYLNPFSVPDIEFELEEDDRRESVKELKNRYNDYLEGGEQPEANGNDEVLHNFLEFLSQQMIDLNADLDKINLNIRDYLGNYSEGDKLGDLYTQRASGSNEEPVSDTASDIEKLQVGSVDTRRDGNDVTIMVSARFKPGNRAVYETDRYGYTETKLIPTLEFHDLSEVEATLVEEFVPVAVEEAGGFAGFRSSATKTNSLIDRLKNLTLPEPSDVENELKKFISQRNKAEELQRKIDKTDDLIDRLVYDLYDLTQEEIKTVEEAI
jgi:hypothetical protein